MTAGLDAARSAHPPRCSGLTARWCPVHGDCACPKDSDELDAEACPLHAPRSEHAIGPSLDAEQVADLAKDVDPVDMAAHLIRRGFKVSWPCEKCGGTGTIPCPDPEHGKRSLLHVCKQRGCDDSRCETQRRFLYLASVEAERLRREEP